MSFAKRLNLLQQINLHFLASLFLFIAFTSCQKNNISSDSSPQGKLQVTASAWLDSRLTAQPSERNQRVELLRQKLDFSGAYTEDAVDNEKLMVIPIKPGFVSAYNSDKNPKNYLLLTLGKDGKIRKGNIVQFVSQSSKIPANTFYKMDTDGRVNVDASLTFLSIFDRFLFTIEYKNGRQISFTEARKKSDLTNGQTTISTNGVQTNSVKCTDWWLVTTSYFPDGHTEVDNEFLETTCTNCLPNELCDHLDDGGGSGNTIDYEYQVYRLKQWKVYIFPGYPGYAVYSWENIRGRRNSSPEGGYFKSASHNSDECNNPDGIWGANSVSVTASTSTASSSVSGVFTKRPPSISISNSESWSFSEVF